MEDEDVNGASKIKQTGNDADAKVFRSTAQEP